VVDKLSAPEMLVALKAEPLAERAKTALVATKSKADGPFANFSQPTLEV
jgi:hypothetical protein